MWGVVCGVWCAMLLGCTIWRRYYLHDDQVHRRGKSGMFAVWAYDTGYFGIKFLPPMAGRPWQAHVLYRKYW